MSHIVTFFVVFIMTIVFIHLSIHLRLWYNENRIEFNSKIIKLNKLIKFKILRWSITLVQSLESSEVADEGTLGQLILTKIYDKIKEKRFGRKVEKAYLCQA